MMTFEQLMAVAAEEADENELVRMEVGQARQFIDMLPDGFRPSDDLANALDYAQGHVMQENVPAYILIKVS